MWLPPGYARGHRHYPVIYLHDGQNVFDTPAPLSGASWGVQRTLARMIAERQARPAILDPSNDRPAMVEPFFV